MWKSGASESQGRPLPCRLAKGQGEAFGFCGSTGVTEVPEIALDPISPES